FGRDVDGASSVVDGGVAQRVEIVPGFARAALFLDLFEEFVDRSEELVFGIEIVRVRHVAGMIGRGRSVVKGYRPFLGRRRATRGDPCSERWERSIVRSSRTFRGAWRRRCSRSRAPRRTTWRG